MNHVYFLEHEDCPFCAELVAGCVAALEANPEDQTVCARWPIDGETHRAQVHRDVEAAARWFAER